ncbi:hypothetical protein GCM10007377_15490 [Galliscardovia ingluviei]|uniref:Uncharacterized protein n=1 Tax=Galliscardovia ingluviei TaxID=1769422 RepID=A0A8J3ARM7_9BIFI|nr:hypothetical protein [Galliscardovia ingluviei]GGI15356.1 hypothetical protein GCM10007377_15490 [Galliscardovia ingluviei]
MRNSITISNNYTFLYRDYMGVSSQGTHMHAIIHNPTSKHPYFLLEVEEGKLTPMKVENIIVESKQFPSLEEAIARMNLLGTFILHRKVSVCAD